MSDEAPSLLTDNISSPFEPLWQSTGVFKINTHLQGHFISLHFHCSAIHCNTVLSTMAKPFKQLFFHIAMSDPQTLMYFKLLHLLKTAV